MGERKFPTTPHGKRARYVQGCRCDACTKANRVYARERERAKARGEGNPLVSTTKARNHLLKLQAAGIGTRVVHDLSGVNRNILVGIRNGERRNCRKKTQDAILDVDVRPWGDAHLVDASEAWKMLNQLMEQGWPKTELARRLGSKAKTPALQLNRKQITARNDLKVKKLYRDLANVPYAPKEGT